MDKKGSFGEREGRSFKYSLRSMGRLVFKLAFEKKEFVVPTQDQLQGFAYFLIKQAGFDKLHDLPQNLPRFFNFSQVFRGKARANSSYYFIFSSPLHPLLEGIFQSSIEGQKVKIGNNWFRVEEIKRNIRYNLTPPVRLVTETPIIIRVPSYRFKEYGIELEGKKYPWFYWRPLEGKSVPFKPFIKQLEARVYKLYRIFKGLEDLDEEPIFSKFFFLKSVDLPYFKDGRKISRIGTLWEFEVFPYIQEDLVCFILDTGLGELTSQGYGFVNLKQR